MKSEELQRRTGENIRRLRRASGRTQREAAEAAGVHWRHWQKFEAGRVNMSLSRLASVAVALGVDVVEVVGPTAIDQQYEAVRLWRQRTFHLTHQDQP